MLMALILGSMRTSTPRSLGAIKPAAESLQGALQMLAGRITTSGGKALTSHESLIWNTAVVISSMISERHDEVPKDAKVFSWASARAGFIAIGALDAAEIVTTLVAELAYLAENTCLTQEGGSASLLRLADLKARFQEIDELFNLWGALEGLVDLAKC